MIVEKIIDLVIGMILGLFSWIDLPELPPELSSSIQGYLDLLDSGAAFIGFFLPLKVIGPFFAIFFIIFSIDHLYPVIMWIVRKIPLSIN